MTLDQLKQDRDTAYAEYIKASDHASELHRVYYALVEKIQRAEMRAEIEAEMRAEKSGSFAS